MTKYSRRDLLRSGGVAAGAVTLFSMGSGEAALAESGSMSVFHVFAFQWKPGVAKEQIARARHDIRAFQGVIPGLIQTHVGPNLSPRGGGYTFGGVMEFKDQKALDAYVLHPQHQALLVWLKPLIDAVELDVQA
jgi:hypothetical protein